MKKRCKDFKFAIRTCKVKEKLKADALARPCRTTIRECSGKISEKEIGNHAPILGGSAIEN